MSLRHSYTLIAPIYDAIIRRPLDWVRRRSLTALPADKPCRILLDGIGTGLDLPHLPVLHECMGIDLTAAMLRRAQARIGSLNALLVQGDRQRLPFRNECFDFAILHLIVAVVPDGAAVLRGNVHQMMNTNNPSARTPSRISQIICRRAGCDAASLCYTRSRNSSRRKSPNA